MRVGNFLLDRGDLEAARECAARAVGVANDDDAIGAGLDGLTGLIAAFDGEPRVAEALLRSALAKEPRWTRHWLDLARFLWKAGEKDEALALLLEGEGEIEVDAVLVQGLRAEILE